MPKNTSELSEVPNNNENSKDDENNINLQNGEKYEQVEETPNTTLNSVVNDALNEFSDLTNSLTEDGPSPEKSKEGLKEKLPSEEVTEENAPKQIALYEECAPEFEDLITLDKKDETMFKFILNKKQSFDRLAEEQLLKGDYALELRLPENKKKKFDYILKPDEDNLDELLSDGDFRTESEASLSEAEYDSKTEAEEKKDKKSQKKNYDELFSTILDKTPPLTEEQQRNLKKFVMSSKKKQTTEIDKQELPEELESKESITSDKQKDREKEPDKDAKEDESKKLEKKKYDKLFNKIVDGGLIYEHNKALNEHFDNIVKTEYEVFDGAYSDQGPKKTEKVVIDDDTYMTPEYGRKVGSGWYIDNWHNFIVQLEGEWENFIIHLNNKKVWFLQNKDSEWNRRLHTIEGQWYKYSCIINRQKINNLRCSPEFIDSQWDQWLQNDINYQMETFFSMWFNQAESQMYKLFVRELLQWQNEKTKDWLVQQWLHYEGSIPKKYLQLHVDYLTKIARGKTWFTSDSYANTQRKELMKWFLRKGNEYLSKQWETWTHWKESKAESFNDMVKQYSGRSINEEQWNYLQQIMNM
ncbi:tryptophan-rich antigen (Pv-fam-a) [Plasmodium malariae]|uniref:Tryptophan-rich antigen (Pv-fam-a) n=1 Tax=Plasmodium malariae TaxID=5858 RepID=A0A1A8WJH1_PLAMA|nr:tryptophan-rich antigen (Pv-fam-a) [Plasmodium malariae]